VTAGPLPETQKVPAAHNEQIEELATDVLPAGHATGIVAPTAQNEPIGQAVHGVVAAPPVEYEPAGHATVHEVAPVAVLR
jgi:hypothetical protein